MKVNDAIVCDVFNIFPPKNNLLIILHMKADVVFDVYNVSSKG